MASEWIWKLDPTISHGASNTGSVPRVHLILDRYRNRTLRRMLDYESLEAEHVRQLGTLQAEDRGALLLQAQNLFAQQGSDKAEKHLLRTFHIFDLGEETSYDLLISLYRDMGFRKRENYWIAEQIARVYNRDKLNPESTVVNMRGTLFPNPHAQISDLPQFALFGQVLRTCCQYHGLEQVFVRGSLARGDCDPYPHVDLLCVITLQDFATLVKQVDAGIKWHHNAVAEGWVDSIVQDYGGIGLVYLLDTDKGLYELDLYVACRGHPLLGRLDRVPHKQEIFRQNRKEGGDQRRDTLRYRLYKDSINQHIRSINSVEPLLSRTLTELSVLGFMTKKCIERGDDFVASNEYNMWKHCLIKLVRHISDVQDREYGFYHVKRLISEADDNGRIYDGSSTATR